MKKEVITLAQYLKFGGKLENIDWSTSFCNYGDQNSKQKIVSFEDRGDKNKFDEPLYWFTFANGNTHKYSLCWISLNVNFVLDSKYLN